VQQPKANIQKHKIRNRFRKALFGEEPITQKMEAALKNNSIYLFDKNYNVIKSAKKPLYKNNLASASKPFGSTTPHNYNSNFPKVQINHYSSSKKLNSNKPYQKGLQQIHKRSMSNPKFSQNFKKKMYTDNYQFSKMNMPGTRHHHPKHMKSYDYLLDNTDWLSMGLLDRNIDGYNDCLNGYYGIPNAFIPQKVTILK
jgi:hypothetical protein